MTPKELDALLRALTEHERLYRRDIDPANVSPLVYASQPSGIPRSTGDGHRAHEATAKSLAGAPHFFVRKHSRFRSYPLHQQDFVELAYLWAGSSQVVVNGETIALSQGQALLVDSDTVHTTLPLGIDDILVVIQIDKAYFDSHFLTRLDTGSITSAFFVNAIAKGRAHDGYVVFRSENSRRLPIFMAEFLCEWYDPSPLGPEMFNGLFALISIELARSYEEDETQARSSKQDPALEAIRHIEQEYATCTLTKLGEKLGLAPDSVTRLLKRECGCTFSQLVQRQRVKAAKVLLASSDLPVDAVARQVGYDNLSFFYRIFERECDMAPGAWRARAREYGEAS